MIDFGKFVITGYDQSTGKLTTRRGQSRYEDIWERPGEPGIFETAKHCGDHDYDSCSCITARNVLDAAWKFHQEL